MPRETGQTQAKDTEAECAHNQWIRPEYRREDTGRRRTAREEREGLGRHEDVPELPNQGVGIGQVVEGRFWYGYIQTLRAVVGLGLLVALVWWVLI